ncbi:hypothetical protein Pan161_23510 [Gimesia algae]|uniref:Uncharacterized protein n=1 Tax=Gimesia algae TaxID=2527971 RepID=A0A517VCI0_9PLAN|nr:hypothetical protein Pan161_23510 [Gimesia algae]
MCVSDYVNNAYCDLIRNECTNEILSPACHGITGRTIFHAKLLSSPERGHFREILAVIFGAIHGIPRAFNSIVASLLTVSLSNGSVPSKCAENRWLNVQESSPPHNDGLTRANSESVTTKSDQLDINRQRPVFTLERPSAVCKLFADCREFRIYA